MATAYTSLLGLALPVTGELSGSWGDTVNTAITSLLDSAVSGTTTLNTDADITLSTTSGVANEARQAILLWTAAGSVTRNITAPARSKAYFVINKTGGTQSIVIRGVGPTTGVTVRAGQQALVVWDGIDFVEIASGNVDGPASATDNAIARFDGTTGKLLQSSAVTIDDSGNVSGVVQLNATTVDTTNVEVTSIKAKNGTAAMQIADSTGVVSVTAAPVLTALTASQAVFTNGSKALVSNAITGTGNVVMSTSPTLVTPALGTPSSITLTNATGLPISTGVSGLGAGVATFLATPSSANLAAAVTGETGTGALVFATSPTLVTPALGTPSSATLTNATGLPISTGVSGLGTGVATALAVNVGTAGAPVVNGGVLGTPSSGTLTNATGLPISTGVSGLGAGVATFLATPSSSNLQSAVTDETGTGSLVFATSPTLVTPNLGTPSALVGTNITGTALGLTAGGVTTNANLTGAVTSVGNATSLGSFTSANLAGALTDETGSGSAVFATSPTLVTPNLGTPSTLVGTNITGTAAGLTAGNVTTNANLTGAITSTGNATSLGSFTSAQLAGALTDETGSGANVFATSPTLVTPALGTPSSVVLTNATGLPIGTGVSGLGAGVATFLATPSSVNLAAAVTDETGTGALVFGTAPVFGGKTGFGTSAAAAPVHVAGDTILSNVNVLSASYDSVSFSVAAQDTSPVDLFFSPDGLKMYIIGDGNNNVYEYRLTIAWVVSSAVFSTSFNIGGQETSPNGLFFRADGAKMYIVGTVSDTVFQYALSTPWSVATASYENISFSVTTQEANPSAISFRPNGLSMYVTGSTGDAVYQYTLSTAWNVSTATFLQSFSVSAQETAPLGICFTGDGSRMFVTGSGGDDVNVYNLTTPWNISTAAFVNVFSVAAQETAPQGIYIKPDGTKMYIVGAITDAVYQYTVPSIDVQLTGPTSAAALDVQQDLNVYGNTTGSFLNNGFRENIGGQYYNLVSQSDIGSAPNEIPLNQYLGDLAYQDAANIAGPVRVGGTFTAVGSSTLAAASMTSATVTGAVEAGGGVIAEQLFVDNFTASSNAVLRGGATNLLTYSEQFADAAWIKTAATITANTIVAPDGTLTGDKVVEDTANSSHGVRRDAVSVISGVAYAVSFFAKAAERTEIGITYSSGNFGTNGGRFNLVTGVAAVVAGSPSISMTAVGNGWYRCVYTVTAIATASSNFTPNIFFYSGANTVYTGDGFSGLYIWGAQLEAASAAGPYLKTVATAVTTAYAAPLESPNGLAIPLLATMTPARNSDMTFELASDTSLVVKVRGSDGTVRSAILLLI